jgi:hypothetical protein
MSVAVKLSCQPIVVTLSTPATSATRAGTSVCTEGFDIIEGFDVESVDIESFDVERVDIESFDVEGFGIVVDMYRMGMQEQQEQEQQQQQQRDRRGIVFDALVASASRRKRQQQQQQRKRATRQSRSAEPPLKRHELRAHEGLADGLVAVLEGQRRSADDVVVDVKRLAGAFDISLASARGIIADLIQRGNNWLRLNTKSDDSVSVLRYGCKPMA